MANDLFGDWLSATRTVDAILYQCAAQYKMDPRDFCREFVSAALSGTAQFTVHPDRSDLVLPLGQIRFTADPRMLPTGYQKPLPKPHDAARAVHTLTEINALRAIALFAYRASAVNETARLYVATRLNDFPEEKTGALVRALKSPAVTDEMLRAMFASDERLKQQLC
jgi:hypothetical protein